VRPKVISHEERLFLPPAADALSANRAKYSSTNTALISQPIGSSDSTATQHRRPTEFGAEPAGRAGARRHAPKQRKGDAHQQKAQLPRRGVRNRILLKVGLGSRIGADERGHAAVTEAVTDELAGIQLLGSRGGVQLGTMSGATQRAAQRILFDLMNQ